MTSCDAGRDAKPRVNFQAALARAISRQWSTPREPHRAAASDHPRSLSGTTSTRSWRLQIRSSRRSCRCIGYRREKGKCNHVRSGGLKGSPQGDFRGNESGSTLEESTLGCPNSTQIELSRLLSTLEFGQPLRLALDKTFRNQWITSRGSGEGLLQRTIPGGITHPTINHSGREAQRRLAAAKHHSQIPVRSLTANSDDTKTPHGCWTCPQREKRARESGSMT